MPLISEVAHHMALLPLLWLGVLAFYGHRRAVLWWTVALVLSVSWMADTAAHWVDPWLVSAFYPLAQAAILGIVLLPRPALWRFLAAVFGVGVATMLLGGITRPEMFAHTMAWAGMVMIAWRHRPIRAPIVTTFALGWLAWVAYSIAPGWGTWGLYQGVRAAGLGVFCWASAPQRVRA